MSETVNILFVAVTQTVHYTTAELTTRGQRKNATLCSKRMVTGYVLPVGTDTVNCPKCLAK